ncbi:MAG: LamG domain-containing protein [Bacteroidota bacterium]
MKKFFFLVLTIAFLSSCDKSNLRNECLPTNLQKGVIAFYPFSKGSLDDATDADNHLTNPTGAVPIADRNGNTDCAYLLSNSQTNREFLTTANSDFLNNLDQFTLSIWYQPMDTTRDGGSIELLLNRGEESRCSNRRGEWSLALFDCRIPVFAHDNAVWSNSITGFSGDCQDEVIAQTDKWHHVVATRNQDNYKIYFNGVLQNSVDGVANCSDLHLAEDIGDLFIGSEFNGKIDDILIYDRELTQMEITQLADLGTCCQ